MQIKQSRRKFLASLAAAGAAGLASAQESIAEEAPPETTAIRVAAVPTTCVAPLYLAEDLLRQEGFAEVTYVPTTGPAMVADDEADFDMLAAVDFLPLLDAGKKLTVLSGVHTGCFELRANDSIKNIADLRGKRVGVTAPLGISADYMLVSTMAAHVGLDPKKDIQWVADPEISQVDLFTTGKVDAFVGFPPDPKQPCMRHIGRLVVNTGSDRPWSDYFCCMVSANADFAGNYPVATKRALRAILKATDICHREPKRAVERMMRLEFSAECAAMMLNDARYGLWRDHNPEDTVRFFALRLYEAGVIKTPPNEVISASTDWRFLNELKRELKA
jgi:NitT/TauT family transport system substrate-binding protein